MGSGVSKLRHPGPASSSSRYRPITPPDTYVQGDEPTLRLQQRTDKYRKQHDDLVSLAGELQSLSENIETIDQAKQARQKLDRFAGKLVVHLAKEDKSLYPDLESCGNREIEQMARRFRQEMGGLAAAFEAYNRRWVSPGSIAADADRFRNETGAIIDTLARRIERENSELYATADAM